MLSLGVELQWNRDFQEKSDDINVYWKSGSFRLFNVRLCKYGSSSNSFASWLALEGKRYRLVTSTQRMISGSHEQGSAGSVLDCTAPDIEVNIAVCQYSSCVTFAMMLKQ